MEGSCTVADSGKCAVHLCRHSYTRCIISASQPASQPETDSQTDSQPETDSQTDRQTDRQRQTETDRDRQTDTFDHIMYVCMYVGRSVAGVGRYVHI